MNAEIHVVDELDTHQLEELVEQITHAIRDQTSEANQIFMELRSPRQQGPEWSEAEGVA